MVNDMIAGFFAIAWFRSGIRQNSGLLAYRHETELWRVPLPPLLVHPSSELARHRGSRLALTPAFAIRRAVAAGRSFSRFRRASFPDFSGRLSSCSVYRL